MLHGHAPFFGQILVRPKPDQPDRFCAGPDVPSLSARVHVAGGFDPLALLQGEYFVFAFVSSSLLLLWVMVDKGIMLQLTYKYQL